MSEPLKNASKFLTLLLRHEPGRIGLQLDARGWAEIDELVNRSQGCDVVFTDELVRQIASECAKQRFEISADQRKVRCRQGHSISIDLGLEPLTPPVTLYHGTATRFLESILAQGLLKQERHHVHLSADAETAAKVGSRHGKLIILRVRSGEMFDAGHRFYLSSNGVWLTDTVPPHYLER